MGDFRRFGETQMDVLREVGNIGSGHAASALANLLGKPVDMEVPRVNFVPFDEIAEQVGGTEAVVVAVFLRVEGDAPGNLFFILTVDSANRLLSELVRIDAVNGPAYSEMEKSALSEIGNILAGSYLSSLGDFTHLYLVPTVPSLSVDMAGAILVYGLLQFGDRGDRALLIETSFIDGGDHVKGHFIFIPDPESFSTIFTALGVPHE